MLEPVYTAKLALSFVWLNGKNRQQYIDELKEDIKGFKDYTKQQKEDILSYWNKAYDIKDEYYEQVFRRYFIDESKGSFTIEYCIDFYTRNYGV